MARTTYGTTPLHAAARSGHLLVAGLLIEKGAEVNAKDKKGRTPLKLALEGGKKKVVALLKKHGAI